MSILTGPLTEIYANTTIPGTAAVAMTAFKALGNSVRLRIVTTTGGAGSFTFTAEEGRDVNGVITYHDVIDTNSVWSWVTTVPNVAGSYMLDLEGLDTTPKMYYRLSYQAATAAGKIQVDALNWENPKGGSISVSVPDVVVDVDNIDVNIEALEHVEDTAHASGHSGVMGLAVRNDALASLCDTDGDYVATQVDASGALYARALFDGTTEAVIETAGTKKALNVNVTDGINDMPTMDANTRPGFVKVTDGTSELDVLVQDAAFGTAAKGLGVYGKYQATPTTYDDNDAAPILLDVNGRVVLSSDIEIGAVELKNGATDDRALISDADTGRATTNHVLSVQEIGADGTVPPTGSLLTNAPFTQVTDGTTNAGVATTASALKADLASVANTATNVNGGNRDAGTQTVTLADDDPAVASLALLDDAIYADDGAWTNDASKHELVGGIYQSAPQTVTDGKTAPIEIDVNGNVKTNISAQGLTAVKISADANANAANNPLFSELTDGTNVIASGNPLNVQPGDGTNVAAMGTGTTKVQLAGIHDGELLAAVKANTAMADDLDGINGLVTASVMHGYVDNDTTHTILVDAAGHIQVDVLTTASPEGATTSATATGAAAIAFSTSIGAAFELLSITLHLSAAGTTSEDFTIGKDATSGAAYDTNLLTSDLSVGSVIDVAMTPQSDDLPQYWKSGDELAFVWPNSEGRTYGLDVQYRTI